MIRNSEYVMSKIIDTKTLAKKAQVGVDLTVDRIYRIGPPIGHIGLKGTQLAGYEEIPWEEDGWGIFIVNLEAGHAYSIQFDQGLKKLNPNETAFILQRSSLNRNGCLLTGSIYDPGFQTAALGATLYAFAPISIVRHARLAQLIIVRNEEVDNEYNGQFQGM